MSDSFIFPDDADGFDPLANGDADGADAGRTPPDGPVFDDAAFDAPAFGTPAFSDDAPASDDAPSFGEPAEFEAPAAGFEAPAFEETPAFEAPAFEEAPTFEAPAFEEAPSADAPPAFGEAPPFGETPAFAEAPAFGEAASFDEAPAFESPAFGDVDFGAPAADDAPAFSDDLAAFGGDPAPAVDFGDAADFDTPPGGDGAADLAFSETFSDDASTDDDDEGDAPAKPKPKKSASKRGRAKDALVLGVHVTQKQVYGVLVRPSGDGTYEPLRQFVRNRAESQFGQDALSPDDVELEEATLAIGGDDPSIQFGGAGEIDFSAEFAGMGVVTDAALDTTATAGAIEDTAQPILFELRDILEECAKAGFARPTLAFAVDAPDVAYAEITVPPEKKAKGKKAKKSKKPETEDGLKESAAAPVKRERLLELVPDVGTTIDKGRTQFLPMSPRDGLRRYLAVAPTGSEPVAESIALLREQSQHRKTVVKTLEAEVPLLVGLVALTSAPEPHENTAVVRVGAEDTIVLLLTGGELHHYEPMQSVTAFDGPDTICSRVLLQQDVQGVGTVHNVVVVSEEREKELVQGFAAFYPEARVETLREGLARHGLVGPYGPLAPALVEAAGVAVAGHRIKDKASPFGDVNLLPPSLLKKRRKIEFSFGWHTLVVAMLLFLSVLYFSYLYVSQEGAISQAEQTLAEFPPEAQLSVPVLQARIDSLRGRQAQLTATLGALDSLLVGTDRWTQTLLRTTRAASQTGGIWIEEWSPDGNALELMGYATTRDNVVGLAQRLNGTIQEVTFQELREYPVYQYQISFDQPRELPQITRVLREQAASPAVAEDGPLADVDAPAAP